MIVVLMVHSALPAHLRSKLSPGRCRDVEALLLSAELAHLICHVDILSVPDRASGLGFPHLRK